jgi:hypothetical protein
MYKDGVWKTKKIIQDIIDNHNKKFFNNNPQ